MKREKRRVENLIEGIMAKSIPILRKKTCIHNQDAQRVSNKTNSKTPTLIHIIIKMSKVKDKERILKAVRGKQVATYKETPIRL